MPCSISTVGPPPSVVKAGTASCDHLAPVHHHRAIESHRAVAQRQVEVAQRVAARDLVGAGAVEEVAGEGAQLGAVEVALVVQRHAVPARARRSGRSRRG